MKVSVCITTFNEKKETIEKLLNALNKQTLKPDEIILIDAKDYDNCSRAEGRNIAIKKAKNEIIATTDVGCVPRKDWLEKLVGPFKIVSSQIPRNDTIVAGFYKMTYRNSLQKAMRVFLGVLPKNFDKNFMPSARSMAFTKTIWKKAGGFPETLNGTAEDTLFNVNLIKAGAVFTHVKNAVVEWGTPSSIKNYYLKIKNYAEGDAKSNIWWHPVKGIQSHNIKILSIYLRYVVLLFLFFNFKFLFLLFAICYLLYAFYKAGIYGPILQVVSDFAVMTGFLKGLLMR